jgi:cytosine deaminase
VFDLIIENVVPWGSQPACSVAIRDGLVVALDPPSADVSAARRLDGAGGMLLPGLVNIHTHLDKAYLAERIVNISGTLTEARSRMREAKAAFTVADVRARADRAIRQGLRCGVTAIRTHVDVDPVVGLRGVEALLELRTAWQGAVDLQIVAFPQEGLALEPRTEELLREALRLGADVVGGHLSIARDPETLRAETDAVFRLAAEFDRDIDVHADIDIDRDYVRDVSTHADGLRYPDGLGVVYLAEKTIADGFQGRVSAAHLSALDTIPPDLRANVVDLLRRANIAAVALPASNLYTHGREDPTGARRGVTRLLDLQRGGVRVAVGTDNIRDPFLPFGNADLVQNAIVAALACHLVRTEDFIDMLRFHTTAPAKIMGLADYGLAEGCAADLLVLHARSLDAMLDGERAPHWVVKRGRVVAESAFIASLYLQEDDGA